MRIETSQHSSKNNITIQELEKMLDSFKNANLSTCNQVTITQEQIDDLSKMLNLNQLQQLLSIVKSNNDYIKNKNNENEKLQNLITTITTQIQEKIVQAPVSENQTLNIKNAQESIQALEKIDYNSYFNQKNIQPTISPTDTVKKAKKLQNFMTDAQKEKNTSALNKPPVEQANTNASLLVNDENSPGLLATVVEAGSLVDLGISSLLSTYGLLNNKPTHEREPSHASDNCLVM